MSRTLKGYVIQNADAADQKLFQAHFLLVTFVSDFELKANLASNCLKYLVSAFKIKMVCTTEFWFEPPILRKNPIVKLRFWATILRQSDPQSLAADLIEPTTRYAFLKPLVQKLGCQELILRLEVKFSILNCPLNGSLFSSREQDVPVALMR